MPHERELATKLIRGHFEKTGYDKPNHLIIPGNVVASMV